VGGLKETWRYGRVLLLNKSSEAVRVYAEEIAITETPTFILFDPKGHEKQRWIGRPPSLPELPEGAGVDVSAKR
jgi:hypothetical protein